MFERLFRRRCYSLSGMMSLCEGNGTPREIAAFQTHVARCDGCTRQYETYADTCDRLSALELHTGRKLNKTPMRVRLKEDMHAFVQGQTPRMPGDAGQRASRHTLAMFAAVAACFLVAIVLHPSAVPLEAETLLQLAVSEERLRPGGLLQTWRVRTSAVPDASLVRVSSPPVTRTGIAPGSAMPADRCAVGAGAVPERFARVMRANHFDPCSPLGVVPFTRWYGSRTTLDVRTGWVDNRAAIGLWVSTSDGPITDALLVVSRDRYRALRLVLAVHGVGTLEIDHARLWTPSRSEELTIAAASSALASSEPAAPARLDAGALEIAELDARLVLRDAGLDLLGDDVRVRREEEGVLVNGSVPSTREREAVTAKLKAIAGVEPALRVGSGLDARRTAARARDLALLPSPDLLTDIDRKFEPGGTSFASATQRQIAGVGRRLHVLRGLAARYPESRSDPLPDAARAKLQALVDFHYQRVRADMDGLFMPFIKLAGTRVLAYARGGTPADWRQRSREAEKHAEELGWQFHDLLTQPHLFVGHNPAREHPVASEFDTLWNVVFAGAMTASRD